MVVKISVFIVTRFTCGIYIRCFFGAVFTSYSFASLKHGAGEYTVAVVGSSLFNRGPLFLGPIYGAIRERELRGEFLCEFYFFFHVHTYADIRNGVFRNNVTDHRQTDRKHKYRVFESSKFPMRFSPFTGMTQSSFQTERRLQFCTTDIEVW